MKYKYYLLKRKIEDILLLPFIKTGRWVATIKPLDKEYDTFFFFPFYHTGGAEKVHALISEATGNASAIIFFTRKSVDDNFYKLFVESGCTIKDVSTYTDNKSLYFANFIFRGMISAYINQQQKKPLVFNGQCNFGYKLSPWINNDIPQIELIHSFNSFSWIRLPFLPFYRKTIMISQRRVDDHLQQYKKLSVPATFNSKIQHIVNGIPLPFSITPKKISEPIKVLYVGRGTEEKRVYLIAQIAEQAALKYLPIEFIFMGDVKEAIPFNLIKYCRFVGHKTDTAEIEAVYQEAHVVIITSTTEGFPLVIEEGMARGCAVMATPVGDIPLHIQHGKNGCLFSTSTNEKLIVQEAFEYLATICSNKELLLQTSKQNIEYAYNTFSIEVFNEHYQQLFNQLRNDNL